MSLRFLLFGLCVLLAVCDFKCLGTGASAEDTCYNGAVREKTNHDRRKAVSSAREHFYCPNGSITVPVKVQCSSVKAETSRPARKSDASTNIRKPEPCPEEERIIQDVKEKQKVKMEAKRAEIGGSPATVEPPADRQWDGDEARPRYRATGAMTAECEQCEIQIKANGDGIFLRCRKCHPTGEGVRLPAANPNRVIQLP